MVLDHFAIAKRTSLILVLPFAALAALYFSLSFLLWVTERRSTKSSYTKLATKETTKDS